MNKGKDRGITLIALVITIIILLILARIKHTNFDWREWINSKNGKKCARNRKSRYKRNNKT